MVEAQALLDLDYAEDSSAEVDFNVVMTDAGHFVELQGTAEGRPFDRAMVDRLIDLGAAGIQELHVAQRRALGELGIGPPGGNA